MLCSGYQSLKSFTSKASVVCLSLIYSSTHIYDDLCDNDKCDVCDLDLNDKDSHYCPLLCTHIIK